MGSMLGIMPFINWINYFFPSLTDYTHFIAPLVMVFVGLFSISSRILPHPGHLFDVPDVDAIEAELGKGNPFILFATKMTRVISVGINRLLSSKSYAVVYNVVQRLKVNFRLKKNLRNGGISLPEKYIPHDEDDPQH